MATDTDRAEVREALSIIENTTRRSLREMRLLVGVLRNTDDADSELKPAPGLCDWISLSPTWRRPACSSRSTSLGPCVH